MTSIPASRSARAMILAPRSCPSRPGFATTTRILRSAIAPILWRAEREGPRTHERPVVVRRARAAPRPDEPAVRAPGPEPLAVAVEVPRLPERQARPRRPHAEQLALAA